MGSITNNLRGRLLLLAHGTMDDDVPPSNTLLVVEALIKANKDFDLLLLPNQRHGYGDAAKLHDASPFPDLVRSCLLGAQPPKEYQIKPARR